MEEEEKEEERRRRKLMTRKNQKQKRLKSKKKKKKTKKKKKKRRKNSSFSGLFLTRAIGVSEQQTNSLPNGCNKSQHQESQMFNRLVPWGRCTALKQ